MAKTVEAAGLVTDGGVQEGGVRGSRTVAICVDAFPCFLRRAPDLAVFRRLLFSTGTAGAAGTGESTKAAVGAADAAGVGRSAGASGTTGTGAVGEGGAAEAVGL
jgi:hypothetical protein